MIKAKKDKIFLIAEYFYPGYRFGGPQQSIYNLCNYLNHNYDIYVYTRSHDYNCKNNYQNIIKDKWHIHNSYNLYYSSKNTNDFKMIKTILKDLKPDIVYVNSLYATFTRMIFYMKISKLYSNKLIIAPRGELHSGAIKLKWIKKILYISLIKYFVNMENVVWHATDKQEKKDILHYFRGAKTIKAKNIPRTSPFPLKKIKKNTKVKFIYLSRIARNKNLNFILSLFKNLDSKNFEFDIYGDIHDKNYFEECKTNIKDQENIKYKGLLPHNKVLDVLSNYHFFILPTKGENFGHAIYESLLAGVPVLISKNTPWLNLYDKKIGWDLDLDNKKQWLKILNSCITLKQSNYDEMRNNCKNFVKNFLLQSNYEIEYKNLFLKK